MIHIFCSIWFRFILKIRTNGGYDKKKRDDRSQKNFTQSRNDIQTRILTYFSLSDSHNKPSNPDRYLYNGARSFWLGTIREDASWSRPRRSNTHFRSAGIHQRRDKKKKGCCWKDVFSCCSFFFYNTRTVFVKTLLETINILVCELIFSVSYFLVSCCCSFYFYFGTWFLFVCWCFWIVSNLLCMAILVWSVSTIRISVTFGSEGNLTTTTSQRRQSGSGWFTNDVLWWWSHCRRLVHVVGNAIRISIYLNGTHRPSRGRRTGEEHF